MDPNSGNSFRNNFYSLRRASFMNSNLQFQASQLSSKMTPRNPSVKFEKSGEFLQISINGPLTKKRGDFRKKSSNLQQMKDLEKIVNNEGLDIDDDLELNEEDLQKLDMIANQSNCNYLPPSNSMQKWMNEMQKEDKTPGILTSSTSNLNSLKNLHQEFKPSIIERFAPTPSFIRTRSYTQNKSPAKIQMNKAEEPPAMIDIPRKEKAVVDLEAEKSTSTPMVSKMPKKREENKKAKMSNTPEISTSTQPAGLYYGKHTNARNKPIKGKHSERRDVVYKNILRAVKTFLNEDFKKASDGKKSFSSCFAAFLKSLPDIASKIPKIFGRGTTGEHNFKQAMLVFLGEKCYLHEKTKDTKIVEKQLKKCVKTFTINSYTSLFKFRIIQQMFELLLDSRYIHTIITTRENMKISEPRYLEAVSSIIAFQTHPSLMK